MNDLTKLLKNMRLENDDKNNKKCGNNKKYENNKYEKDIKPQKPLLIQTNRDNYCYDCQILLDPFTTMGSGVGVTGIDLYFCQKCYMTRFRRGEGEIINFQDDYIKSYIDQVAKEWRVYISNKNIPSKCFNCEDKIEENKCYMMNGFIGEKYKIFLCNDCQKGFFKRMVGIFNIMKKNNFFPSKDMIESEISYYFYSRSFDK